MSKGKKVASFLDNAQFLEKVGSDSMSKQKKVASFLDNVQFLEKVGVNSVSNATLQKGSPSLWNVSAAVSDEGLLVTNINQTQDLLRLKDTAMLFAGLKSTDDWIQVYGLKPLQLSFNDLMKKGSIVVNPDDPTESIEFTKESVNYFESELRKTIALYDRRIEWLLQDSRKIFGMIRGDKVGVLIDTSDVSCGPRLQDFQRDLLSVIDEQLLYMKKLYFLSFGTNISLLWEKPRFIDEKVLDEARQWVLNLKPSGGCNLLKALKKALTVKELNSLVIVVGSCPDQASEILSEYIQECTVGRKLLVHTVTYDCSNQVPPGVVRSIAEDVGGHYHCYSSKRENCDSTDIQLILLERQKAKELLNIINEIYQGRMGDTLFNVMKQGSMECLKLPSETSLPKPPKHECPLAIQIPSFLAQTSAEWLKTNGLKARKLSLYQVLAPNAFSPVEEFVPVLRKMVSSTLHEKAMTQFEWHDGTIKNIHVDPPILYDYQKRLGRLVRMYERRVDWLSTASRSIWGTVCEKRIVILIDVSKTNAMYIIHIQHSLRLLLEEQMSSKDFFNIIAFGNDVKAWQAEMVPSHLDNLQRAWNWVLTLQCEGTRNLMTALRRAVEIDFKDKDKHTSQSIFLLTTGVPDQEKHAICSYLAEVCGGCDLKLHVCLFSVDGFSLDDIPPRYASLNETAAICKEIAQTANGRFHWFGETGIYESDDISIILSEMEKAVNYSHKCALLVGSLRQRSGSHLANQLMPEGDLTMLEPQKKSRPQRLPFPKPTALTLARMNFRDQPDGARNGTMKALLWRPPSAKAEIPPVPSKEIYLTSGKKKHNFKSKKRPEVSLLLFYADKGKKVGAVYKKYSNTKNVKKQIPVPVLPFEEEICSSKAWLSRFSIKKLKLDLPSLVFGPECVHQKEMVASLHKQVSAKYCDIFPSVEIHGIVKHLQIQPKDLEVYIEQMERVLRCYVRRVQWLLSGSRRLFGVVLEANVCILIDTSGSMDRSLQEVTKELTSLIWEQLRRNNVKFSLISFAEDVDVWQECLVEATNETCHDAVQWLSTFHAHGNTSILKALRRAFSLPDVEALYILTDGKPDTSCSLVLKEIEMLLKKRAIIIHTISFNCSDRAANDFLKKLAFQTGGRYHRCHGDVDGQMAAHRLLSEGFKDEDDPAFPLFEGDDLKKLVDEIAKARSYLTQAKFFKSLLEKKNVNQKDRCP
ncbi:von Willebrand factor A domain-containing protein 3A isoform X1 [Podarcis raffonei]|uniref:von Willebrand factor A domain-containing protein 3A isoform X1 n=1 Tax=Podarcis raffonei TaxID=65483 RepID=UPI0023296355|nr:von Willebrand factor A domain-containing protein 3A isoform X1 [Podarcis raffonei]